MIQFHFSESTCITDFGIEIQSGYSKNLTFICFVFDLVFKLKMQFFVFDELFGKGLVTTIETCRLKYFNLEKNLSYLNIKMEQIKKFVSGKSQILYFCETR